MTAVAAVVATGIYVYVPPFVPVFASLGPDIPISGRILVASYPFAFLLPLAAAGCGIFLNPESSWRRLLAPLTYIVCIAVIVFVVLALYVPVFELSAAQVAWRRSG
jgi:type II secretory pathway component PulF